MSLQSLKPSHTFKDQIKVLALMGYSLACQVDEEDLYPVARAWLLENVDLEDRASRKMQTLPMIWTRSVCSQVIEWSEFNHDCDAALSLAFSRDPFELAIELWHSRGVQPPEPPKEQGSNVIPFPNRFGQVRYLGGPAA